ncbi:MAG: hypothetical protein KGR26_02875 [Cyanobacteria bacterium REEB65]|nr:hypothetical protein [Cyanobacteria bacterium REEB65]
MASRTGKSPMAPDTMAYTHVVQRPTRSLGSRLIGGFFLLLFGVGNGFLAGAGTGAIANRLIPQQAEIVSLTPRVPQSKFRLETSGGVLCAIIDTKRVRIDLARGWDQELKAFDDSNALLYFTGPFFEEEHGYGYDAKIIGDVYFYGQLTLASPESRGFADRRYYLAISRGGRLKFGFGGWQPGYESLYDVYVGGLGYLYGPEPPPPTYSNPYSGLTQRIHDAIPRERLIVGKDADGHLVVIKTRPTMTKGAIEAAESHGLVEAYFLDQGNKARFIAPGQINDRPRYNLPYLLRVADRDKPWIPDGSPPEALPIAQDAQPPIIRRHHRRRHPHVASQVEGLPGSSAGNNGTPADGGGFATPPPADPFNQSPTD